MRLLAQNVAATVCGQILHMAVGAVFLLLVALWFVLWWTLFGPFEATTVLVVLLPLMPVWSWFLYRYFFQAAVSVSWGFWAKTLSGDEISPRDHLLLVKNSLHTMRRDVLNLRRYVSRILDVSYRRRR